MSAENSRGNEPLAHDAALRGEPTGLNLDALRRQWADLCDRMAEKLFAAGLDFDDVELLRRLVIRVDAAEIELDAEFLSDARILLQSLQRQLRARGLDAGAAPPTVVGLKVCAVRDRAQPPIATLESRYVARERKPTLD